MTANRRKALNETAAWTYLIEHEVQVKAAENFIDEYRRYIAGETLELGCGLGMDTRYLVSKVDVPLVVALDKDEGRIQVALKYNNHPHIRFVKADALELRTCKEIGKMKFSTVISHNLVHETAREDQLSLFSSIRQFLKPTGVALFLATDRSVLLDLAIKRVAKDPCWVHIFKLCDFNMLRTYESAEYYRTLGMRAGFYYCNVVGNDTDTHIEVTEEQLKHYLEGWLPHTQYLKLIAPAQGLITRKQGQKLANIFLDNVLHMYFNMRGKSITSKVDLQISRNRMILFASKQAVEKHLGNMTAEEREKAEAFMFMASRSKL